MYIDVNGPDTVKFKWKVSSESNDYLEFYINGVLQSNPISGTGDGWQERSYTVGTGSHTFRWQYTKDGSTSGGEDHAWVDWVQWSGPSTEPATDAWGQIDYAYDASGRRIEKKYDGRTVLKYIYDGDHCIAEYGAGNDLHRKYVYGPGVDQPICLIEAAGSYAGTYYYHFDGLGSVVALTNASGNTVQTYDYDVYGRVGALDASHPNRLMFTGREFDKETGLYYYRARYYKPEIGRFLQVDQVGYKAGMNLYRYCSNNPWNYKDPFGLQDTNESNEPNASEGNEPNCTIVSATGKTTWYDTGAWAHLFRGVNSASLTFSGKTCDGKTFVEPPTPVTSHKSTFPFTESEQVSTNEYSGFFTKSDGNGGQIQCYSWSVEFTWKYAFSRPPDWPWYIPLPSYWMKSTIKVSICADGATNVSYPAHSKSLLAIGWDYFDGRYNRKLWME